MDILGITCVLADQIMPQTCWISVELKISGSEVIFKNQDVLHANGTMIKSIFVQ